MTDSTPRAIVLVVEDDDDLRNALDDTLTAAGYEVHGARDGVEALRILEDVRPALIITDLMMQQKSGWTLLTELDDEPELAAIPRIVITAAGNEGPLAVNAPLFIKPVRTKDLLRAVAAYISPRSPREKA